MLLVLLAHADDPLTRARAAQRAGDPVAEAAACAEIPEVAACRERLAWLDARRDADGSFSTWSALERIRRDASLDDAARRSAVEALAATPGMSEATRTEITMWRARERLGAGDAEAAITLLEPLAPSAQRDVVLEEARARVGEAATGARAQGIRKTRLLGLARIASLAVLGVWALAALALRPRRVRPWGVVPLALAGLGCAAVGAWVEPAAGRALAWLIPGQLVIFVVAASVQPRLERRPGLRAVFGGVTALAMAGAAVLTLDATGLRL